MRFYFYLVILIIPLTILSTPRFPFPQNVDYPYGIRPVSISTDRIQSAYETFLSRFYEESPDKSMARIKWDTPSQTVSEGIGYGMLIMVYMDNKTNNTQSTFDKLWKYYNSFLNQNGLMHWKIDGFTSVAAQNAATDAELDVATALVQAYKQWGDQKYLDDAKTLIDKIWRHEVNANGYIKPGDTWDSKKSPSYLSIAAFESFKHAGSQNWDRVISSSFELIKQSRNQTTGLVPDWCQENGGSTGNVYYYDAARTPWRISWGYLWYGHNDAKEICSTIAGWITSSTSGNAASVGDRYELDGTKTSTELTSTFLGGFACAAMVDATHQQWLNRAYQVQDSLIDVEEKYYGSSLKMIYLLLLSGNMPDLWNPPEPTRYRVTVAAEPAEAGSISVIPAGSGFSRGDTVTISIAANAPFTFERWSGDTSSTDSVLTIVLTKNLSVTAHFNKVSIQQQQPDGTKQGSLFLSPVAKSDGTLRFMVPRSGNVTLELYSLQGKRIDRPVNTYLRSGIHTVSLPATLAKGMYLITLRTVGLDTIPSSKVHSASSARFIKER